jgi:hypothetical protein
MIKFSLSASAAKKVGMLMIVVGIIWSGVNAWFVMQATKGSGEIIEIRQSSGTKERKRYYPIFQFTDASGRSWTNRSTVGYSVYDFNPGDKVEVLYSSSDPSEAQINTFTSLWSKPLFVGGFGILLVLVSPLVRKKNV